MQLIEAYFLLQNSDHPTLLILLCNLHIHKNIMPINFEKKYTFLQRFHFYLIFDLLKKGTINLTTLHSILS